MVILLISLGLAILIIGWLFRSRGRAAEKRLGVPVRRICAADVGVEVPQINSEVSKTLVSHEHQAKGIPDYLVDDREEFVPIEVKSARVWGPYDSDVYQLLTQCFLSEEDGRLIRHGRLVYANQNFDIPYSPSERQKVLQVLAKIRQAERVPLKDIPGKQDHRCRGCVYRTLCQTEPSHKAGGLPRGFGQARQD